MGYDSHRQQPAKFSRVFRTLLLAVGDPNDTHTITIETNCSIAHAPYALPTHNPRAGRIPTVITSNVTLACVTGGATIHYQIESLDRDDVPTEPSQTLPGAWSTYAGPFSISVHLRQIASRNCNRPLIPRDCACVISRYPWSTLKMNSFTQAALSILGAAQKR